MIHGLLKQVYRAIRPLPAIGPLAVRLAPRVKHAFRPRAARAELMVVGMVGGEPCPPANKRP